LSLGPSRFRSAHRVVVWVFASSSGPPCRGWAVRVFVEPAVSSLGPPYHGCAVRVVVGPIEPWLGPSPPCRGWALGVAVEPPVSLLGPSRRRWAIRIVVGHSCRGLGRPVILRLLALSLGLPCGRVAPRVFVSPAVSSFPHSWCGVACLVVVQPFPAVRIVVTSALEVSGGEERGKSKNELRQKSWPVLVTHWLGLPLPGSPLWLLLPLPIFLLFTGPHPSEEGRGTAGLSSMVGSEVERQGGEGGGEEKINHFDAVDVQFKLRSPAQKSCSILAYRTSIYFLNCTILVVYYVASHPKF